MSADKTKSKEKNAKKKPDEADSSKSEAEETPGKPDVPVDAAAAEAVALDVDTLQDRLLRLQADFDNYRKRMARERGETFQRANEGLMEELLPVLDHFEMGLNTASQHSVEQSVIDGFDLVYNQLLQVLAKFDLKAVDAEGQPFDPHQHEAITHVASEEHPADIVIAQTRRGYMLGTKLLRAAQVVVSSGPTEGATGDETVAGTLEELDEGDA